MADDAAAKAAASAAWLAQEHPEWSQQSTSAEQAASINAAWRSNTLPVIPQYANPVGYSQADLADAAQEQAKHERLFHPEQYYGVNPANLGNVPLSVIAARYGTSFADTVSGHFVEHPSERYQAITSAYEEQQNRVVSVGTGQGPAAVYQAGVGWVTTPEVKGTAAAQIAREVGKTGGAVDPTLGIKAYFEGAKPSEIILPTQFYYTRPSFQSEVLTTKEGQHFMNKAWEGTPIRANISLEEYARYGDAVPIASGIHTAPGDWGGLATLDATKGITSETPDRIRGSNLVAGLAETTSTYEVVKGKADTENAVKTYVPYGSYTQEELDNTRLAIDKRTGEVAIYQYNPTRDQWSLIGGGGRNALQSGMFSVGSTMTPYVTTQAGAGTYVLPSGVGLTRLGSEVSGGFVRPMSEMTPEPGQPFNFLAPNEVVSRYYGAGAINLANFVDQVAAGKAEAPGAHIHWTLPEGGPAIQYMDKYGLTGQAVELPAGLMGGGRLVGSKTVASVATYGSTSETPGLPTPFISTTKPALASEAATSGPMFYFKDIPMIGGLVAAPFQIAGMFAPEGSKAKALYEQPAISAESEPGSFMSYASGGYYLTADAIAGMFGVSTVPSTLAITKSGTPSVSGMETTLPEQTTVSGGSKELTEMKDWINVNRPQVQTPEQAAQFNIVVEKYNKMAAENPMVYTTTGGKMVTTTTESEAKVYRYGQFDVYAEKAGEAFRGFAGSISGTPYTQEQFKAYAPTVASQGPVENIGYGVLGFMGERPLYVLPYAAAGAVMVAGGELVGGALGAVSKGTGYTARAAQILTTTGEAGLAGAAVRTAASLALPVYLTAKGAYDITEGGKEIGTAKMYQNVGGSIIPMGAMAGGALGTSVMPGVARGASEYAATRFAVKPHEVTTLEESIRYSVEPSEMFTSGQQVTIGKVTTETIARQPSFLGYEFPRIFEPKPVSTIARPSETVVMDAGYIADRMSGTPRWEGTVAARGGRTVSLRLEDITGSSTLRGTGRVAFEESTLPRTMEEYIGMGKSDVAMQPGRSAYDITSEIMSGAWETAKTTKTGERYLDVAVERGTPIREAFGWTATKGMGTPAEFAAIKVDPYIREYITVSEAHPVYGRQTESFIRQAVETGRTEEGVYISSLTPEQRVEMYLQRVGQEMQPGGVESAYGFTKRGYVGEEVVGNVMEVAVPTGYPYSAHTHPLRSLELGPEEYMMSLEATPSAGDLLVYSELKTAGPDRTSAAYIVSPHAIKKFTPSDSWEGYRHAATERVMEASAEYPWLTPDQAWRLPVRGTGGAWVEQFGVKPSTRIGLHEEIAGGRYTELTSDVSRDISSAMTSEFRAGTIDILDRLALRNPNLEFVREQTPAGLGKPMGAGPLQYGGKYMAPQALVSEYRQPAVEVAKPSATAAERMIYGETGRATAYEPATIGRVAATTSPSAPGIRVRAATPLAGVSMVDMTGVSTFAERSAREERVTTSVERVFAVSPALAEMTIPSQREISRTRVGEVSAGITGFTNLLGVERVRAVEPSVSVRQEISNAARSDIALRVSLENITGITQKQGSSASQVLSKWQVQQPVVTTERGSSAHRVTGYEEPIIPHPTLPGMADLRSSGAGGGGGGRSGGFKYLDVLQVKGKEAIFGATPSRGKKGKGSDPLRKFLKHI
jgi:hypothetical protein